MNLKIQLLTLQLFLCLIVVNLKGQTFSGCHMFQSKKVEPLPKSVLEKSINGPYYIKLYISVLREDDGSGGATQQQIEDMVTTLNNEYNQHDIFFYWDCFVDDIPNSSLYNNGNPFTVFGTLYTGGYRHLDAMDIFVGNPSNTNGGGAAEYIGDALYVFGIKDGVQAMTGVSVIHEMGHCLGLLHTDHQTAFGTPASACEFVDGSNGADTNDFVADTPSDPGVYIHVGSCVYVTGPSINGCFPNSPLWNCNSCTNWDEISDTYHDINTAGFPPNGDAYVFTQEWFTNYMGQGRYSDQCKDHFTPGQIERMCLILETEEDPMNTLIDPPVITVKAVSSNDPVCIGTTSQINYLVCPPTDCPSVIESDVTLVPSIVPASAAQYVNITGVFENGSHNVTIGPDDECINVILSYEISENIPLGTTFEIKMEGTPEQTICPQYLPNEFLTFINPVDCTAPCDCPANSIIVGSPDLTTSFESVIAQQPNGPTDIHIFGTVEINTANYPNGVFEFKAGSNICMQRGAEIIVKSGSQVNMTGTHVRGCDFMWQHISAETGATLNLHDKAGRNIIEDGEFAVEVCGGATLGVRGTDFLNNHVGIYSPGANSSFINSFGILGNVFTTSSGYLPPYEGAGQIDFPHAGIWLVNTEGLFVGSPGGGVKNHFSRLNNGIIVWGGGVRIMDAEFFDIANPDDLSADDFNGIDFRMVRRSSIHDCFFNNCNRGVRAWNSNLSATQNQMLNVNNGIYMDLMSNRRIYLANNNELNCISNGIILENSPSILSLRILDNIVKMEEEDVNAGGIGIFSSSADFSLIDNNVVRLENSSKRGFDVFDSDELVITNNNVFMDSDSDGFVVTFSDGCTLQNNTSDCVNCTDRLGQGFFFSNCEGTQIICNTSTSNWKGFEFHGACSNTFFASNESNYLSSGFLPYRGLLLENAIIGPQPEVPTGGEDFDMHGNRWNGVPPQSSGSFNAVFNGDPNLIFESMFTVHTSASPFHPIEINAPGSDWFVVNTDETGFFDCNDFFSPETPQEDIVRKAIANNKIADAGYGHGSQWLASRQLFSELYHDPSLITPGAVQDFYNQHLASNISEFNSIDESVLSLFTLDGPTSSQLGNELDAADGIMGQIDTVDQQLVSADETAVPALLANREGLLQQLSAVNNNVENIYTNVSGTRTIASNQVIVNNTAINVGQVYETNLKTVNDILLNTLPKGTSDFDAPQTAQLTSIASQCPEDGGDAVYMARALLAPNISITNPNCGDHLPEVAGNHYRFPPNHPFGNTYSIQTRPRGCFHWNCRTRITKAWTFPSLT